MATQDSESTALAVSRRRAMVGEYLAQRATDPGQIAAKLGCSKAEVEEDIKEIRKAWRKGRREKLEEVGDSTLQSLDTDELVLRQMLAEAQKQKSLTLVLKIMDMISEKQKLRLQIAGLLSAEGVQSFRAGVSEGLDGDGAESVYRLYADELEGQPKGSAKAVPSSIEDQAQEVVKGV